MEPITIRYGESLVLPVDTGDITAVFADIYIGKPGQTYILTKHITLSNGSGVFSFSQTDTQIPLGTHYYQINVTDANNFVEKYPSPAKGCEGCENDFPAFVVCEALDAQEVS